MFCKFCGTKVDDTESTFCGKCGARLKDNGFDEIVGDIPEELQKDISEEIQEDILEDTQETPTPIEVEPTGNHTFKDKITQMFANIGESIQRHKKWSIGIATGVICLCAIGVGIYFGYEDQPVVNNMVSSSLPVIKPKEHKEEKKNYDTIEIKADDTKDIQFLLNEQKEKDRQGFSNEAQNVARNFINALGQRYTSEAFKYLTTERQSEAGDAYTWGKSLGLIDSNFNASSVEINNINGDVAWVRVRVFVKSNYRYNSGYLTTVVKLVRNGTTVRVDSFV